MKKQLKTLAFRLLWMLLTGMLVCACNDRSGSQPEVGWDHSINFGWTFALGDHAAAIAPDFDDSEWEVVDLPHDWAIHGPFGPFKSSGGTGKLPWKGEGWYRKRLPLPATAAGERLQFLFDGVMSNPTVYLNGQKVGAWRYGYNSFWVDATEAARFGDDNWLVVHADTREHASRWYPGAGLYRKVGMRLVDPTHIPVWGLQLTTPEVSKDRAMVRAAVEIVNQAASPMSPDLHLTLMDPSGRKVASWKQAVELAADETITVEADLELESPALWDIEHPHLYSCRAELKSGSRLIHATASTFGVRTFRWTADDGFHLNGRRVQLQGVNLHHDHGPLGAAFFPRAMERQLEIMQDMGVNAIRTSHNAPAPELLELCDRMGFIVYNELFDKYGAMASASGTIAEYVEQYAEAEVANFVRRDRNHPSVFLWSIGNEISRLLKNSDGRSAEHIAHMVAYFKKYDRSRPTSMGCHIPSVSEGDKKILDALDTTGWNYGRRYASTRKAYPDMPLIYSETASAFGTRGAYKLDLPERKNDWCDDGEMNAYMLTSAAWSDIPEHEFEYMRIDRFIAGEFVWTGFDYLGEPTPVLYRENPTPQNSRAGRPTRDGYGARSSYFGIVDLAGLPKDSYYNYRSLWNKNDTTVHLAPHWNWEGHEGQSIPVFVYTSGDEAELFLNGKSLGRKKKIDPDTVRSSQKIARNLDYSAQADDPDAPYYEILDAYRLRWLEVPYEPGELKVVAYRNGEPIGEAEVRTAGAPARLRLRADRTQLRADGMDLSYVTIEMVDADGNLCPRAMDKLNFHVEGAARLMGVANGNQMGHDPFTDSRHPLFYGKAVAVLRSIPEEAGAATLTVSTEAGKSSEIELTFEK